MDTNEESYTITLTLLRDPPRSYGVKGTARHNGAIMQTRINVQDKADAERVARSLGLTVSQYVKMLVRGANRQLLGG